MKKSLWILLGVILVALLYYLVVRPFEFEVNFKARTLPGDLIETIRIWNRSLDSANVVEVDSFSRLKQTIILKKRRYVYNWHFASINDSLTKVNIQISQPGRSFLNKLLVPFTRQPIEDDASEISNTFYDILKEHIRITKVKVLGETELDSSFCVCTALKTEQIAKANGMMKDYPLLSAFIDTHKLKVNGPPIVNVTQWNHELGLLEFDYCFPIHLSDSLPSSELVTYKKINRVKVLKAEYRGNYITSDRAWYALIQYAGKNGYRITGLPIEHFHDNPNMGMNELNWKADIYLAIEK